MCRPFVIVVIVVAVAVTSFCPRSCFWVDQHA